MKPFEVLGASGGQFGGSKFSNMGVWSQRKKGFRVKYTVGIYGLYGGVLALDCSRRHPRILDQEETLDIP